MEEFQVSDSDEDVDEAFDIYGADPTFKSKEELDEFMASCKLEMSKKTERNETEEICFDAHSKIIKKCTCSNCEDIWSENFEHICCQQIKPG